MKRYRILCAVLLLCLLACAAKPKTAEPKPETLTAPGETAVTMTLPVGIRDDVAKALPAFTAGFSAPKGETPHFSAVSGDPSVADCVLKEDGTLYVIARGAGETKLTVTARTDSGEEAAATVSVKVADGRRTLALIVLGVLSVVLLALLGKPSAKKSEPEEQTAEPTVILEEEPKDPVVIFEEPEQESEIPKHDS